MTQEDYAQAKKAGQVQQDAPAADTQADADHQQEQKEPGYTLNDFLPVLIALLTPKVPLTSVPTFTPKNFMDSVQLFDDGSTRALYLYVNGTWRSVPLGTNASGRSYLSSSQSVTSTFNTKITFDTNDFANGITWDGANNRFTCVTAGKYLVVSALQWSSPAANFQYTSKLYKNGVEVSRGSFIPGNYAGFASSVINDIVTLAVGDTVEIYGFQTSSGTVTVSGASALSFLSITQVST